jgi:hypothetical protein
VCIRNETAGCVAYIERQGDGQEICIFSALDDASLALMICISKAHVSAMGF